jgi:hypothetical protein
MEIGIMKQTTFASSKDNFTFSVGGQGIPKCTLEGEGEVGSKKFTLDAGGDQTNIDLYITTTASKACEVYMAKAISKCGICFNKNLELMTLQVSTSFHFHFFPILLC